MDAVVTSQLVDRAVALVSGQGDLGLEGPPWIFRLPAIGSPPLGHEYSLTGGPVFGVHYTRDGPWEDAPFSVSIARSSSADRRSGLLSEFRHHSTSLAEIRLVSPEHSYREWGRTLMK